MSQDIYPPIYGTSFVGIWKRMFLSGRPDPDHPYLFFNANGSCYGPIGPGSNIGNGNVTEVIPEPTYPKKGVVKIKFRNRRVINWTYTLNQNNGFRAEFHPLPGSNTNPPNLNELLLVGEGVRQLYAFFSHSPRPIMVDRDILGLPK